MTQGDVRNSTNIGMGDESPFRGKPLIVNQYFDEPLHSIRRELLFDFAAFSVRYRTGMKPMIL